MRPVSRGRILSDCPKWPRGANAAFAAVRARAAQALGGSWDLAAPVAGSTSSGDVDRRFPGAFYSSARAAS
eukprot:865834-Pyramimonas_sp.AAC.1